MDLDERVFKWFIQLWRKVPLGNGPTLPPSAVELADHSDRFELLAAMLFGQPIDIAADSGVGGVAGRTMFLPDSVALCDDYDLNRKVYVYRAAWGSTARRCGFEGAARGRDPLFDALCTALSVAQTRERMHADLPSTAKLTEQLNSAVLRTRKLEWLNAASGALELLTRRLLGDSDLHEGSTNSATRAWVEDALSARPRDTAELHSAAHRLLPR